MIDKNVKELVLVINKMIDNIDLLLLDESIIKSKNTKCDYKYIYLDDSRDACDLVKRILTEVFNMTKNKELVDDKDIDIKDINDNGIYDFLNFKGLTFDENIEYLLHISKGLYNSSIIKSIYLSYDATDVIVTKTNRGISYIHQIIMDLERI